MDKVWFKLRQTHYPPGPEKVILSGGGDGSQAPLCLGHCLRDLQHLDFPLNPEAIAPFPSRMRVFRTQAIGFHWDEARESKRRLRLGGAVEATEGSVSVATTAAAATAGAGIELAFAQSVEDHEAYERVDTYIVQPTPRYVEQVLDTDDLRRFVAGKLSWSFFMITGLRVARSGRRSATESRDVAVGGGPGLNVPGIAAAEANGTVVDREQRTTRENAASDFVWAVRLAKIHKGILMTDWSIDPYTRNATFSRSGSGEVDVAAVFHKESLSGFSTIEDDGLGEVVVVVSTG